MPTTRGWLRNVIDGNGEGVMIGGDATSTSDDNRVERNVVTNSAIRDNVESAWAGDTGTDNFVRENCLSGGVRDDGDGGIADLRAGFVPDSNLVDDPLYANRGAKDFRLRANSPCHALFGKEPAVSCTKVASTTGSDSAAGTAASPYRTVDRLADSLQPGQTGCLRAGTFERERAHRPRRAGRCTRDDHQLSGRARGRQRPARGRGQRRLRDDLAARPRRDEPATSCRARASTATT